MKRFENYQLNSNIFDSSDIFETIDNLSEQENSDEFGIV